MSDMNKETLENSSPSVTLTVGQLKTLIKEGVQAAMNGNASDKLLDAQEAARLLCVTTDWLYRNARKLPFSRKLGRKMLRFSSQGIQRYLATRKIG